MVSHTFLWFKQGFFNEGTESVWFFLLPVGSNLGCSFYNLIDHVLNFYDIVSLSRFQYLGSHQITHVISVVWYIYKNHL